MRRRRRLPSAAIAGKFCYYLEAPEANREAEARFDRSIELDPRFASAYAWKACTIGQAWRYEFLPRTSERQQRLIQFVEQAMSIDENNAECHRIMRRIALLQGQLRRGSTTWTVRLRSIRMIRGWSRSAAST
jgi:adenylate cyclase